MESTRRGIVIFDLDGTLVDSRKAIVDAVAAGIETVARELGHPQTRADRDAVVRALGLPSDEYFRRVLPANLVQHAARVKRVATELEVRALAEGEGRLFPGTLESLITLREGGWRVAVVSNAQRPYFRAALEHLGLQAQVDHSECQEELPKELEGDPKTVLVGRALSGRGGEGIAVVVGDRAEDIQAGRAHGCRTVGATHGFGSEEELALADHRVDGLPALAEYVLAL